MLDSAVFVNSTFGKRQQWDVDGGVHAQPLYAPGILVSGQPTNMLLVVTEHATLYALNAGVSQVPETYLLHGRGAASGPTSLGVICAADCHKPATLCL